MMVIRHPRGSTGSIHGGAGNTYCNNDVGSPPLLGGAAEHAVGDNVIGRRTLKRYVHLFFSHLMSFLEQDTELKS